MSAAEASAQQAVAVAERLLDPERVMAAPGGLAASLIIGQGYLADPGPPLPATAKAIR